MKTLPEIVSKFKVKSYINVEYHDIDDLINTYFETDYKYECVAYQEWSNYSSYTISVYGKDNTPSYDILSERKIQEIENIKITKKYNDISLRHLLNYLSLKDIIPSGEYLIKVSW